MGDNSGQIIMILWVSLGLMVAGAATVLITFGFWMGS